MVKGKKVYGSYKTDICVFCGGASYGKNKVGLPTCKAHKHTDEAPAFKCTCGMWLDVLVGKFGAYAQCLKCGNMNLSKVHEYNASLPEKKTVEKPIDSSAKPVLSSKQEKEYKYGILLD